MFEELGELLCPIEVFKEDEWNVRVGLDASEAKVFKKLLKYFIVQLKQGVIAFGYSI